MSVYAKSEPKFYAAIAQHKNDKNDNFLVLEYFHTPDEAKSYLKIYRPKDPDYNYFVGVYQL